jgi:lipopolysaccharide transport system permease protein
MTDVSANLRYKSDSMDLPADHPSKIPTVQIEPAHSRVSLELDALWAYRQLLFFLTWRDLKVRYKQTVLGAGWAILQPFLATVVFTIFFGRVAHLGSEGVPYLIFAFAGTLPWTYVANATTNGSLSLVNAAAMITKVYFPRMALPISAVLGCAVDFLCAAVLLIPIMAYYGFAPTPRLLALPLYFALATGVAVGVAMTLAALNVNYRDVKYVVPFFMQMWLFASPVVYSAAGLSEPWSTLYAFNPMVGVIDGFRWSILGTGGAPGLTTAASLLTTSILLVFGAYYLRHVDESMADVI